MMREIINNNSVIFGLVFSLFSSTLSIVVGWFALFGGSIGLLIGNNLF